MCLQIHRIVTVATTTCDHIPLLRRGTDASAAATEGRRAALGLALIILENEKVVGAEFYFRAQQGLVGRWTTPVAQAICGLLHNIVVGTNCLVTRASRCAAEYIIRKALAIVGETTQH